MTPSFGKYTILQTANETQTAQLTTESQSLNTRAKVIKGVELGLRAGVLRFLISYSFLPVFEPFALPSTKAIYRTAKWVNNLSLSGLVRIYATLCILHPLKQEIIRWFAHRAIKRVQKGLQEPLNSSTSRMLATTVVTEAVSAKGIPEAIAGVCVPSETLLTETTGSIIPAVASQITSTTLIYTVIYLFFKIASKIGV